MITSRGGPNRNGLGRSFPTYMRGKAGVKRESKIRPGCRKRKVGMEWGRKRRWPVPQSSEHLFPRHIWLPGSRGSYVILRSRSGGGEPVSHPGSQLLKAMLGK